VSASHLTRYLSASAQSFPDRPAVVGADGDVLSYAELERQSNALAHHLVTRGVRRGDRVGIVMRKRPAAVVAIFGILKAGAGYVPVDHAAPAERGRRILTDCRVQAVIVDERCLGVVPPCDAAGSQPVLVVVAGAAPDVAGRLPTGCSILEAVTADAATFDAPDGDPGDLAYILYTSGSTGLPKGAMLSHRNVLSFIDWCSSVFAPTPNDRFSNHAPFHFDASVVDIFLAIKHGASVHLVSEDLGKSPRELARFIVKRGLTVWFSTPSILSLLVQYGQLDTQGPTSLRLVLFGGEVFPVRHLRELRSRWRAATFYNLYGPTEATVACTFARIPDVIPDDRTAPYPIGFPCSHCDALVIDAESHEADTGEEGRLYIRGPSVFLGYWNRPAENEAAFMARDGMRWYDTGDVVRRTADDGFVYVGRQDRMVKRRGYRIELGEIEAALLAHPWVAEAAVIAEPDPAAGVRIVAYIAGSAAATGPLSIIELKTFCATKVPAYMSPDQIVFQPRLPRTASDKIDYQALKKPLLDERATTLAG